MAEMILGGEGAGLVSVLFGLTLFAVYFCTKNVILYHTINNLY